MTVLTDTQVVTASGGLVELGYVAFSSQTISGTGSDAAASSFATPITISFVSDGSPILLEVSAIDQNTGANAGGSESYVVVFLDSVFQRRITRVQTSGTITESQSCNAFLRMTAAAGAHTIELKQFRVNANGNLNSGYARVSKIVQATQWPAVTTGTIICTSSTRPASPFAGQQIYETDTSLPYTYNGTIWTSSLPAFLSASGTDVTAGAFGGNIIYTFATVTLTPGTWLVTAGMGLINTTTADGTTVGLYNRTTSTEVASSRGGTGTTQTALEASLVSRQVSMTVTANTQVCPYGTRNGGSTIKPVNSSGGTPGYIQATRISIP